MIIRVSQEEATQKSAAGFAAWFIK